MDDEYYVNALKYNEGDNRSGVLGTAIKIGGFFEDGNDSQQDTYTSAMGPVARDGGQEKNLSSPPPPSNQEADSDPDYPNDNGGLELRTVMVVLHLDRPQPIRLLGLVDVIRTRFDLIKQIVLTCTTDKCPNRSKREVRTLKVGMFSVYDLPFVFPGGREALDLFCRCSMCRQPRRVEAGHGRYQSARIIEFRNVTPSTTGSVNGNSGPNNTDQVDRLMVLVLGKHAQDIGFSEEVEMIGELQIMPSSVIEARRGSGSARNPAYIFEAEPGGKYQKIFYAKHIKYTKRERELVLTEQDIQAIKRFVSLPKLVRRLISMFAPNVAGFGNAKLVYCFRL